MELNALQSLIFGFVSGLCDILPVSAQGHKAILLKLFGVTAEPLLLRFVIHGAALAALYYCNQNQLMRIRRQLKLARIPKKRRKRPLDQRTILDFRLLRTMAIPLVICLVFYYKTASMGTKLNFIAIFSLLNAVVLYLPVLLPSGNKDSRTLTRMEGLLMGLCGGTGVLPGMSCMAGINSLASLCGADRTYGLNLSLILQMVFTAGMIVFDIISMFTVGLGALSFGIMLGYLLAAAMAFLGVFLAVKLLRAMAANIGFHVFAYYSLGVALFSFILFLSSP